MPFSASATDKSVWREIEEVHSEWRCYQASRSRDAIYPFLASVFELVQFWRDDGNAKAQARAAIQARGVRGIAMPKRLDLFSATIIASAYPWRVEPRALSKWSRILQYASDQKPANCSLAKFIKRKGGLNACEKRYLKRRRHAL